MQVYVIPAKDGEGKPLLVRQPFNSWLPVPEEGKWVELDEYWARRIRDGDVIEGAPPTVPEGEPLDLTDEERAALPLLDPDTPNDPKHRVVGSMKPAATKAKSKDA